MLRPDTDTEANSVQSTGASAGKGAGANAAGNSAAATARAGSAASADRPGNTGNVISAGAAGTAGTVAKASAKTGGSGAQAGAGGAANSQTDDNGPVAGSGGETNKPTVTDAGTADGGGPAPSTGPQDADCDLTGIWIARQITVSEAIGVSAFSNNWYYFEFKQNGTTAEVTKHFDCGIQVVGAVTVILPRSAVEAQMTRNLQAGRNFSFSKDGAGCRLDSKRFWSIRGAEEQPYLPGGARDSEASIRELVTSLPLPTADKPEGAIDPDGDGKLGLAFEISGLISGTRNSVQRDWTRWFSDAGYEFPSGTDWTSDLNLRADFDNEESVLDPMDGLLSSGSVPKAGALHAVRLRFLGRDASDPRAAAFVKESQIDTCYAIQDAFPAEELQ